MFTNKACSPELIPQMAAYRNLDSICLYVWYIYVLKFLPQMYLSFSTLDTKSIPSKTDILFWALRTNDL